MVIYVTSQENEALLREIVEEKNLTLKNYEGNINLLNFVKSDVRNLNNCEHFVVDLKAIEEKTTPEEIMSAFSCFRKMYGKTRITIVAIGYKHGNILLARLFAKGIYNIITAPSSTLQKSEIEMCFSEDGMLYRDSSKFEIENIPKLIAREEKVIIKREKMKQTVTIGVLGTQDHIGTTTQAILITKFLNSLNNISACYIEPHNKKSDISYLTKYYTDISNDEIAHRITFEGIDLFTSEGDSAEILSYGYDFYVYDMGNFKDFDEKDIESFVQKEIKIIVSGSKAWETKNLISIKEKLGKNKLHIIFNFTPEDEKNDIQNNLKTISDKIYFSEYAPYPFSISNSFMYNKIFKNYILNEEFEVTEKKRPSKLPKFAFLKKKE